MQRRITLNSEQYSQPHIEEIRGVPVEVMTSLYTIPTYVTSNYDEKARRFELTFHYSLMDEPVVVERDGTITLHVGKFSNRLVQIEIALGQEQFEYASVVNQVTASLKRLMQRTGRANRSMREENFQIARDVITERGNELLQPFAESNP